MRTKTRIINGERYVPVCKTNEIIFQKANITLYRIGNLKTPFIKVNVKGGN